ncbi:MAG TPA: hypothetical protein VFR23_24875 [Jiangellaceae bacterium]|nr:hypothetical protein [Jiangellaceae bacterium]
MPMIAVRTALGANGTANPLSGSQYEYLPFDAFVEFGLLTDATGVLATIQSGTDVLTEEGPVQVGTINQQPKYPDDFFLNDVAAAGERLKVALRDTSGAARVVQTVVRITPL